MNFAFGPGLTSVIGGYSHRSDRERVQTEPTRGGGVPGGGQAHAGHADWYSFQNPLPVPQEIPIGNYSLRGGNSNTIITVRDTSHYGPTPGPGINLKRVVQGRAPISEGVQTPNMNTSIGRTADEHLVDAYQKPVAQDSFQKVSSAPPVKFEPGHYKSEPMEAVVRGVKFRMSEQPLIHTGRVASAPARPAISKSIAMDIDVVDTIRTSPHYQSPALSTAVASASKQLHTLSRAQVVRETLPPPAPDTQAILNRLASVELYNKQLEQSIIAAHGDRDEIARVLLAQGNAAIARVTGERDEVYRQGIEAVSQARQQRDNVLVQGSNAILRAQHEGDARVGNIISYGKGVLKAQQDEINRLLAELGSGNTPGGSPMQALENVESRILLLEGIPTDADSPEHSLIESRLVTLRDEQRELVRYVAPPPPAKTILGRPILPLSIQAAKHSASELVPYTSSTRRLDLIKESKTRSSKRLQDRKDLKQLDMSTKRLVKDRPRS